MFRLESGYYLVLLAVIPLLYLLYVNYKQKQEVLQKCKEININIFSNKRKE